MSANDLRTRCVLLAPAGQAETVTEQLRRQGWIAHAAGGTLAALAELCLLDRALTSRRDWGLSPVEQLALVVVESTRWSDLGAMLAAARRYVPAAAVWTLDRGALSPWPDGVPRRTGNHKNDHGGQPYQSSGAASEAPPKPGRPISAPSTPPPPPSVTGEEIGMLLDGEEDDR